MLSGYLDGGQVDCGRLRGSGRLGRRSRRRRRFGLFGGSLWVLLGCHFRKLLNYFVPGIQAIPSWGDNTRSAALSGGDSEQEITVWAYIYEAIFPLDPVKAVPLLGLDSRWAGVCSLVQGPSLNMEYGSATQRAFIYAIYIQM